MTTGEKIRDLRKRQGLSQEQLANLAGLSRQAVSRWEAEDAVPETAMIIQLSEIFQVTTDYLLKDTESGAGANAGSSDATGGHAHNRGNRRLWVGPRMRWYLLRGYCSSSSSPGSISWGNTIFAIGSQRRKKKLQPQQTECDETKPAIDVSAGFGMV